MKAIIRSQYGPPDVMELQDVEAPAVGDGDVLVRVRASSVNMADADYVRGRPWVARIGTGLREPRAKIPGRAGSSWFPLVLPWSPLWASIAAWFFDATTL